MRQNANVELVVLEKLDELCGGASVELLVRKAPQQSVNVNGVSRSQEIDGLTKLGGGFRAAGFARPAFGGYGWRGGYPRFGGYGYWGGYPRYGYYRRGWGYGGGALAAGLIGGAILGAGLSAATTCDLYSGWGCSYGYGYAYPAYYGYGYPAETVVIRRTYYGY